MISSHIRMNPFTSHIGRVFLQFTKGSCNLQRAPTQVLAGLKLTSTPPSQQSAHPHFSAVEAEVQKQKISSRAGLKLRSEDFQHSLSQCPCLLIYIMLRATLYLPAPNDS